MSLLNAYLANQRSPVYRQLQAVDVEADAGANTSPGAGNGSSQPLATGALIDFSLNARCGVRGPGSGASLHGHGLPQPGTPNTASRDPMGRWVMRLSQTEYWLLMDPLRPAPSLPELTVPRCYPVYCEDSRCWFALTGECRAEVMAKLCGVDLRRPVFKPGTLVQTSLARVNAVILHHEINGQEVFSIFSDTASAEYLWSALLDAMAEFGGKAMKAEGLA